MRWAYRHLHARDGKDKGRTRDNPHQGSTYWYFYNLNHAALEAFGERAVIASKDTILL